MDDLAFIKRRDPKGESEKLTGAKYAFKMCLKYIRRKKKEAK
jgi:hypothetical protein